MNRRFLAWMLLAGVTGVNSPVWAGELAGR